MKDIGSMVLSAATILKPLPCFSNHALGLYCHSVYLTENKQQGGARWAR
jgi:hypothetical protein